MKGSVPMNKSVYSLVLSDDVIAAVDRMAYAANMSRSAYINSVLAEAVSYVTPEKRLNNIFGEIEALMSSGSFQVQNQPSDTMISIRSALRYKYKPVIRYGLEIYRTFDKTIGQLRVSFRTQSERLKAELENFIGIWIELEKQYILRYFPDGITYSLDDGRFTRTFQLPKGKENLSDEEIAASVSKYIKMFDDIIKIYFENADYKKQAAALVAERYSEYWRNGIVII